MENLAQTNLKSNLYLFDTKRDTRPPHSTEQQRAGRWKVTISTRPKLNRRGYEYNAIASNGMTEVGVYGGRVFCFHPHARLEGELRGVLIALDWLRHVARRSRSQIILSPDAYSVVMNEGTCPVQLKAIRNRLLAGYIASRSVVIRCAGVSPTLPAHERQVAA